MRAALASAALALGTGAAHGVAASLRFCERASTLTAGEQDRLLQFAGVVRQELAAAGGRVAIVARSGQDLARFGVRYSHAGVSLQAGAGGAWSVRQLYYACDERRPRVFDQGLPGFLLGTHDPRLGYASLLVLPPAAAAALEAAARDDRRAVALLGARYSANAHPWRLRYQNCNQWVAELLAAAWAGGDGPITRARAQRWLAAAGYDPRPVDVGSHLVMAASWFVPWLHHDDHPAEDRLALQVRTSLPQSIEDFVRARLPGTRRIEVCHDGHRAVVREGWTPIAEGCHPEPGDRVVALD